MAGPQGGERLATSYDLLMFDLDGVVYVDGHAVDHAAESIADARGGRRPHRVHHQQRLADPRAGGRPPARSWGSTPTRATS